jgi:cell wall-associated NlpC family hydrolase
MVRPTGSLQRQFLVGAAVLSLTAALLFVNGCGASSPRFRNQSAGEDTAEDENEIRFASKIREEVAREDDRKVDPSRVMKARAAPHPTSRREERTPSGLDRDKVLLEAVSFLGVPYAYGGSGKEGIDCSGFTAHVYQTGASIVLPRSTREQYKSGRVVERDSLQFGDLVFFNTTGRSPSHVGIYIEDNLFAHASVTSGVTISSLESTYYKGRFVGARRLAGE